MTITKGLSNFVYCQNLPRHKLFNVTFKITAIKYTKVKNFIIYKKNANYWSLCTSQYRPRTDSIIVPTHIQFVVLGVLYRFRYHYCNRRNTDLAEVCIVSLYNFFSHIVLEAFRLMKHLIIRSWNKPGLSNERTVP
jgi:hypothetical protein